jgi:hypothetical protein
MEAKVAVKSRLKPVKRIAGMRIPKGYRRAAAGVVRLSRNPLVREMAAAGVVAAAGVLLSRKGVRASAEKVGEGARGAANDTVDIAGRIGQVIASAIASAAHRLHPEPAAEERAQPAETPAPIDAKGAMPYVS